MTEAQKTSIREIYRKIVHVKFRWGGQGYIQVSRITRFDTKLIVVSVHLMFAEAPSEPKH